jgi:hypothetical protein
MEAAVPVAHSTGRSGSWLSGWRLAWIPAAALATVVGLALLVHGRHGETGTEMAKAVPPIAPQNEASIVNPPANNRVEERKVQSPVSPVVAKQSEIKVESAPAGAAYVPVPAEAAAPAAAVNETVTVTSAPPLMTSKASVGQVMQMEPLEQMTTPTSRLPQRVTGTYSGSATADRAAKAKMDDMAERYQASRKAEGRYAGSGGASNPQLKKDALPSSSFDAGGQMPVMQFAAAREANIAPLPSGLTAVSTVAAENRMLAIDKAGALFLSKDSGSHWESVAQQWTGRAVDVILLQYLSGSSAAATPASGAAVPPSPQPEVFELRNDKNLTWVSIDGTTWIAQ